MGCSVKRGSPAGATELARASVNTPCVDTRRTPRTSETAAFARFEKAFIRVQTVMLSMTAQIPQKWVQNHAF